MNMSWVPDPAGFCGGLLMILALILAFAGES